MLRLLSLHLTCKSIRLIKVKGHTLRAAHDFSFAFLYIWYSPLPLWSLVSAFHLHGPVLCYKWRCWEGQNIKGQITDMQTHRDTPSVHLHTSSSCFIGTNHLRAPPHSADSAAVSQITNDIITGEVSQQDWGFFSIFLCDSSIVCDHFNTWLNVYF